MHLSVDSCLPQSGGLDGMREGGEGRKLMVQTSSCCFLTAMMPTALCHQDGLAGSHQPKPASLYAASARHLSEWWDLAQRVVTLWCFLWSEGRTPLLRSLKYVFSILLLVSLSKHVKYGEMAQQRVSAPQDEDLSSSPQHPRKSWVWMCIAITLAWGFGRTAGQRQPDLQKSLARQSSWINELQLSER